MRFRRIPSLAVLLLLPAIGCAHPQAGATAGPAAVPRLVVNNRSSSDMDVYLVRQGQRIRLGLAAGDTTTRFSLPVNEAVGAGLVSFLAVPINGGGETSSSEPTNLSPGAEITLDIPPP